MSALNQTTAATDAAELVIAGENDDLTTDRALTASEALAAVERIEVERAAAIAPKPAVHLPLIPVDGMLCMLRKEDGQLLKIWTKEDSAKLVQHARAKAENEEIDYAALRSLRAACRSLLRIPSHDVAVEQVASAAAYFGNETGPPVLRDYVENTCPPDLDVDFIIGDLWCEACAQRGDTFEDWEIASDEPGGWRWLVRHVRKLEGGDEPPTPGASANPSSSLLTGGVKLILGSTIKPKPYDWLWPGMLVRGKLHLIAGAPGCGKTTIALSFAATATTGGLLPDGTRAPACDVIIWSSEDDIADTLVPRLIAAGADMDRIHFVAGEDGRSFDPATDMAGLRAVAEKLDNVGLLIVDPIVSAVAGDSHKNAETRRGLQPLVDLAESLNAALLGITHFTKGTAGRDPLERVTGSLAFGAVARIVFAAAKVKNEEGDEERVFVRTKSNIGPDGGGFKFALKEDTPVPNPNYPDLIASTVVWGDQLEGSARDLLKEAEGAGESSSKTEDAAELIQETIRTKGGEASANDLHAALKAAGIGENSRYRAIKGLLEQHRIARVRYVENGPWTYIFPRRGGVADVSAFDPVANDSAANGDLVDGVAS